MTRNQVLTDRLRLTFVAAATALAAGLALNAAPAGALTAVQTLGPTNGLPAAIAVDGAGNVYTANSEGDMGTVSKITPDGKVTRFGPVGDGPAGIAVDSAGNIFTANRYNDNVSKITPDGKITIDWAPAGVTPVAIAVDEAGFVYVANEKSSTVTRISPDGTPSGSSPNFEWAKTDRSPQDIAIAPDGTVYTVNSSGPLTDRGEPGTVSRLPADGSGANPTRAKTGHRPVSLAIVQSPGGQVIYTANYGANTVSAIYAGGGSTLVWGNTGQYPTAIAASPVARPGGDSNIFVANSWTDNVSQFSSSQRYIQTLEPTGAGPSAAAVDKEGTLYVANYRSKSVTKFTACDATQASGAALALAAGGVTNTCAVPASPRVSWATRSASRKVTARFRAQAGVSYRLVIGNQNRSTSSRCKVRRSGSRLSGSCSKTVAKGTWRAVVTPTRGGVTGTGPGKTIRVR
ncbi:MAG: NHL repeat-containing protein [Solirubrobacterales bacterium]